MFSGLAQRGRERGVITPSAVLLQEELAYLGVPRRFRKGGGQRAHRSIVLFGLQLGARELQQERHAVLSFGVLEPPREPLGGLRRHLLGEIELGQRRDPRR